MSSPSTPPPPSLVSSRALRLPPSSKQQAAPHPQPRARPPTHALPVPASVPVATAPCAPRKGSSGAGIEGRWLFYVRRQLPPLSSSSVLRGKTRTEAAYLFGFCPPAVLP